MTFWKPSVKCDSASPRTCHYLWGAGGGWGAGSSNEAPWWDRGAPGSQANQHQSSVLFRSVTLCLCS